MASRLRSWFKPLALGTLGLGGAVLVAVLIGVGEVDVKIMGVGGDSSSSRLAVATDSCGANPRVDVDETPAQVRMGAYARRRGLLDGRNDCIDNTWVTLQAPLGNRVIIDISTGAELIPSTD